MLGKKQIHITDIKHTMFDRGLEVGKPLVLSLLTGLSRPRSSDAWLIFTPSGVETRSLQDDNVNIMAADALAPPAGRSSATTVLTVQDRWTLVFHEERFELSLMWKYKYIVTRYVEEFSIQLKHKALSGYNRCPQTCQHNQDMPASFKNKVIFVMFFFSAVSSRIYRCLSAYILMV